MEKTAKQRVLDAVNHCESDRVAVTFDAEREVYEMLYRHFGIEGKLLFAAKLPF